MRYIFLRFIITTPIIILVLFCVSSLSLAAVAVDCGVTMNDVEGPYYLSGAPIRNNIAGPEEKGERLIIKGTVLGSDCRTPVRGALIEVWQTDTNGTYYYSEEGYRLRGQLSSGTDGNYWFSTVKPGRYGIMNGFRPAHIHLKVSHPDYVTLITQVYFKGDPYLWPNDACGRGCRSDDPYRIILLRSDRDVLSGVFDIILKQQNK